MPPVPPRITNPPPPQRHRRISENLVIIDTDDGINHRIAATIPIPMARTKSKPSISPPTATTPQSFATIRMAFENNFVQNNSFKPNNVVSRTFIDTSIPPPTSTSKLSNKTESSEVGFKKSFGSLVIHINSFTQRKGKKKLLLFLCF